ncbi:unnamed protein product [Rotaria sp. Silwood1]|nr:unnamed protein product [Rotaria sp. Silwood1]
MADKYGRRPIIGICLLLTACSGFICTFFPQKAKFGFWSSYSAYTLGRFILACTTRGIGITGFVLVTELVGPRKKFLAAIIIHYCFPLGQLVLVVFAYFIREWRRLTLALTIFTIPFIFLHFLVPESARWMISKGQYEQAEKLLRKIAKTNKRPFDEEAFQRMIVDQEKARLWVNLPTVLFGILSLVAALLVLMLPETLNKTLPQTIEDTEQMGLVCIRIRDARRSPKTRRKACIENDQNTNEDLLLSEQLKVTDQL